MPLGSCYKCNVSADGTTLHGSLANRRSCFLRGGEGFCENNNKIVLLDIDFKYFVV